MTMRYFFVLLLTSYFTGFSTAQENPTPAEKYKFDKVTSYDELSDFIHRIDSLSELVSIEKTGVSVQGRELNALLFSASAFGKDPDKIRVLIFAQQHGNEQSGKEGALLLARELIKPENRYLFENIDFALIPQVNPDGSEVNTRRNGNDADLNRNHLTLTEPETMALHAFFDKYQFEVTMDVHEYSPYGEDWVNAGYRKNSEVTLGTTTNPNVSGKIREFSGTQVLSYILSYISTRNYSSFVYCPGDPPGSGFIRHSTFDINDGRQSFGIQNTLSFIQEGMNGKDNYTDNLKKRAEGQMTGMRGLIEYVYSNKKAILKMIGQERKSLANGQANTMVSIQSDHTGNGTVLQLPVFSYKTGKDSLVQSTDYRPVVKSLTDVEKPLGYLVPENLKEIIDWADRHHLTMRAYQPGRNDKIQQYFIQKIDSIDFEGDIIVDPVVSTIRIQTGQLSGKHLFIPTSQQKGNLIVLGLEPKSMLGLVTYRKFSHLLKTGETFPILRIEKK
jgi:Zinc carboxypeptidase